MVENQVIKE